MTEIPSTKYAKSDEEAADRAKTWMAEDPFCNIPMALLSAAHIDQYVRATGMIYPFNKKGLKAASYEVKLRGTVVYWGDDKVMRKLEIKDDESHFLALEPNSITFVQVEPTFRLPHYMAIRFNLRIALVHRGLLLGTGPLVDPGFEGRLLIPLHNLTSSKYHLDLSKELIWIEFTKTTYTLQPNADYHFPEGGKNLKPSDYLYKASGGDPILSSIPEAVKVATDRAVEAEKQAAKSAKTLTTVRNLGFIAVLTAVAGISSLVYSSFNLVSALTAQMLTMHTTLHAVQKDLDSATARMAVIETNGAKGQDLSSIKASLDILAGRLDSIDRTEPQRVPKHGSGGRR